MRYKNQIRIRTWARIYPAGTTRISGKVIYVSRYTFVPNLSFPDDVCHWSNPTRSQKTGVGKQDEVYFQQTQQEKAGVWTMGRKGTSMRECGPCFRNEHRVPTALGPLPCLQ